MYVPARESILARSHYPTPVGIPFGITTDVMINLPENPLLKYNT